MARGLGVKAQIIRFWPFYMFTLKRFPFENRFIFWVRPRPPADKLSKITKKEFKKWLTILSKKLWIAIKKIFQNLPRVRYHFFLPFPTQMDMEVPPFLVMFRRIFWEGTFFFVFGPTPEGESNWMDVTIFLFIFICSFFFTTARDLTLYMSPWYVFLSNIFPFYFLLCVPLYFLLRVPIFFRYIFLYIFSLVYFPLFSEHLNYDIWSEEERLMEENIYEKENI